MIDADTHNVQQIGIKSDGRGDASRIDDRSLAQGHDRHVRLPKNGLRDDVHRIGVVEDSRVRTYSLDIRKDALEHVDRSESHEQPARALRLLADHAVRQWDPLVKGAGLEPARPEAREHGIRTEETFP